MEGPEARDFFLVPAFSLDDTELLAQQGFFSKVNWPRLGSRVVKFDHPAHPDLGLLVKFVGSFTTGRRDFVGLPLVDVMGLGATDVQLVATDWALNYDLVVMNGVLVTKGSWVANKSRIPIPITHSQVDRTVVRLREFRPTSETL